MLKPATNLRLILSAVSRVLSVALFAISMTLLLASCKSVSGESTPAIQPSVPPAAVTQCPPLPQPTSGTWEAVRQYLDEVLTLYGACRDYHGISVEWVRRRFKLAD